jgi:hypothetical protein
VLPPVQPLDPHACWYQANVDGGKRKRDKAGEGSGGGGGAVVKTKILSPSVPKAEPAWKIARSSGDGASASSASKGTGWDRAR